MSIKWRYSDTLELFEETRKSSLNQKFSFKNWNGVQNLKNIKNKTLIIWGNKDKSYDITQVNILKKNILNSSLNIFKNCAHNIHLEKVNEFNSKVQEFLKN